MDNLIISLDVKTNLLCDLAFEKLAIGNIINAFISSISTSSLTKHLKMRLRLQHS